MAQTMYYIVMCITSRVSALIRSVLSPWTRETSTRHGRYAPSHGSQATTFCRTSEAIIMNANSSSCKRTWQYSSTTPHLSDKWLDTSRNPVHTPMYKDITLVLDTETTGLAPRALPSDTHSWQTCRIVEIAWEAYDPTGALVEAKSFLVRPDGFNIPAESTRIHGITHDHACEEGVDISEVWDALDVLMPRVRRLVAHNMAFDDPVVQSEMMRSKHWGLYSQWIDKERYCTMLNGTIPGSRWPKLVDLYVRLFDKKPDAVLHRAGADVRICAEIYHQQMKTKD